MISKTPFYKAHKKENADFTEFAGYDMPVRYDWGNIKDEHRVIRESVGMFDVSHMGRYWVYGQDAKTYLNYVVPRDIKKLENGKSGYTFILNENGGFKDDIIISQLNNDEFMVVCNAGNRDKIWTWMTEIMEEKIFEGKDVYLEDKSDISSMLAVQGPESMKTLKKMFGVDIIENRFRTEWYRFENIRVLISTTGYTGENGVELIIFGDDADLEHNSLVIWEKLLALNVKPCGLGARDTLRIEAGYHLYGQDLSEEIHLLESGLGFKPLAFIEKESGFKGQEGVLRGKGIVSRTRVGFKLLGRGIARYGYPVVDENQLIIGKVTSGTRSPLSDESIGMAYVDKNFNEVGSRIFVDMKGNRKKSKLVEAEVIGFPTYDTKIYGLNRDE